MGIYDGLVLLLARRVPDLRLDDASVLELDFLGGEFYADCVLNVLRDLALHVAHEEVSLAHIDVAD